MAAIMENLLPAVTGENRKDEIVIDTRFDRLMKMLTVWLPLLVSGTLFLGDFTGEPQNVVCYPPSNFTIPQANYLNSFCKESLVSEQITSSMFPYFVLLFALLMYIPHLLWKLMFGKDLTSQIANIIGEIENSWQNTHTVFSMPQSELMPLAGGCMPSYSATIGLIESRKWGNVLVTKIITLLTFALACLMYLIWFDIVEQKSDIFVCSAKLSENGTREEEYLESVCKVVGKQYLYYYVSIFLSISFCIGVLLPIFFVLHVKLTRVYLLDIINSLKLATERVSGVKLKPLPNKIDVSPFSDFFIISRLCGENRHVSSCLHEVLNIHTGPTPNMWVDTAEYESTCSDDEVSIERETNV
ncbi:PREDICTED: pannexin-1-like [Branchiostoma belcheri]|uniref:Pannexin-1-like n=1 Tax=Branchiostoma belcheri TaxID=7741 RepID=A0A6P5AL23_BRABE|nr:PREDICTED: pannexin-1-like [Branchiostoma belcheri]XP_019642727.1 PREDICTED: pannexin-1-like [Branchiostoma belcheri]XP_019642728.1 PREDICTED: pannexin-1-like [Branchiostoma belcheri]XP_019642729.1 PREDICTED: pannexin-1-like [Branchiostoma belcheri]